MMKHFIDIHTHNISRKSDILSIKSILIKDEEKLSFDDNERYSIALHPWDISDNSTNAKLVDSVKLNSVNKNVLAIGEAGLDFAINIDKNIQIAIFKKQIEISEYIKKPLIIHCVKAYNEILQLRNSFKSDNIWIIHGFSGSLELADQLIKKNIYLSFGKEFMKKGSKTEQNFLSIDLDHVFFETDDEKKFNIEDVYKKAANLLGMKLENLQEIIRNNFHKIFGKKIWK